MKTKRILLISLILSICLSGCSNPTVDRFLSSDIDIYISNDVDIFGNKIDKSETITNAPVTSTPTPQATKKPSTPITGNENLKVYFLDVGQADSILIQINNDENILIDGGNNADGKDIVSYLKYLNVTNIDTIIATHPHEDHIGGLDDIIDNIETDKIYMPYINDVDVPTTITYEDFLMSVMDNELIVYQAENGQVIYENDDIKLEIISPTEVKSGDLNRYSIVTKLQFKDTSFIFAGDATNDVNQYIMDNYDDDFIDVDVLKLGHHGSYTSSNMEWIKKTSPTYGIVMCGKDNQYGHPHKEPVDILNKNNSNIYRTDLNGTILIESDGKNLYIDTKLTGDYPLGHDKFKINNVK